MNKNKTIMKEQFNFYPKGDFTGLKDLVEILYPNCPDPMGALHDELTEELGENNGSYAAGSLFSGALIEAQFDFRLEIAFEDNLVVATQLTFYDQVDPNDEPIQIISFNDSDLNCLIDLRGDHILKLGAELAKKGFFFK